MRVLLISLLMLFVHSVICGQQRLHRNQFLETYRWETRNDSIISISSESVITALAIKSAREASFYLLLESELLIPKDEDAEAHTYFISLPRPASQLQLRVPDGITIDISLISSGETPVIDANNYRKSQDNLCEQPLAVLQETWRSGLPEPNYSRSFHEVFHNVIHHSAGSNSNTNYTQVVRDIYLYHTQVNGWSDIGYNYLIAQDGTLYAGRDPGIGRQDQVRGAHFCGANTGTMGVCVLGNYETATITPTSLETLEALLSYTLNDQGRRTDNSFAHPLGTLGTVIGHRDGCSTLCPGENIFNMLTEVKARIDERLDACEMETQLELETEPMIAAVGETIRLDANGSYNQFSWLLPGGNPEFVSGKTVYVSYARPGFYDITLVGEKGASSDTIEFMDYLQVSRLASEPIIFPNPVSENSGRLTIDFEEEILQSILMDINGKYIKNSSGPSFEIRDIQPGTYFLDIITSDESFRSRIIIR